MNPDGWLTVDEAARALGISTKTVRRRIASGQYPSRMEPTPKGDRWLVQVEGQIELTAQSAPAPSTGQTKESSLSGESQSLALVSQGVQALRQYNSELATELSRVQDERVKQAEELGRLRAEVERLEAENKTLKQRRGWLSRLFDRA